MPLIHFKCNNPSCDNHISKVFVGKYKIPPFLDCGQCGVGKLERQLKAPSSGKTEFVDNGLQARKIELRDVVIDKETEKSKNKEK